VRQRLRQTGDRAEAVARAQEVADLCRLHDLREQDLPLALRLHAEHPALDALDATYAAVALNRGVPVVLSPDRAFDAVPGLRRVDPADAAAVRWLSAARAG
jgi:predicted nucleic acid-binding protein